MTPLLFVLATLFTLSRDAQAQANYDGIPLGGRTAMMGGTAVARGEDQATPFINPAGITRIPGQSLAFSTVAFEFRSRNIQGALDPSKQLGISPDAVNQLNLRILPNTFCLFLDGPPKSYTSSRSRHKYAVCGAASERESFDFNRNNTTQDESDFSTRGIAHSTSMSFVRSTLAFSWGLQLNRDTSLGVTSRVDNTTFRDQTAATAYAAGQAGGVLQTLTHSINAWSWDTSLLVGITSNISRIVTLGASLTTPSAHLFGSYVGSTSVGPSAGDTQRLSQDNGDFRYNHPGGVRMGLAFSWPRLILEINGNFYGPQPGLARVSFDRSSIQGSSEGQFERESRRGTISERGKPVTNLLIGMEYFFERNFSIVTGLQTDFSGLDRRRDTDARDTLFRQQKDVIHASLGVTTYGKAARLLLGLRGHYGWGNLLIADAALAEPQFVALDQNDWGVSLIISGDITFRSVKETAARAAVPFTQLPGLSEADRKSEKKGSSEGGGNR